MTNDEFKEAMLDLMALVHGEQKKQNNLLEQLMVVSVDSNAEITTVRSRLIEQASRHGTEIHEHEKAILDHEARLFRVERKLDDDHGPIAIEAE